MQRYKNTKKIKDINNKRKFESTIYPDIPREVDDIYFISTRGDRLDLYADKYYSDTTEWPLIAQANGLGKGTLAVPPGIQIRIPMNTEK